MAEIPLPAASPWVVPRCCLPPPFCALGLLAVACAASRCSGPSLRVPPDQDAAVGVARGEKHAVWRKLDGRHVASDGKAMGELSAAHVPHEHKRSVRRLAVCIPGANPGP